MYISKIVPWDPQSQWIKPSEIDLRWILHVNRNTKTSSAETLVAKELALVIYGSDTNPAKDISFKNSGYTYVVHCVNEYVKEKEKNTTTLAIYRTIQNFGEGENFSEFGELQAIPQDFLV